MSGIVGLLRLNARPVDQAVLNLMTDRLAHRGPDGRGVWSNEAAGLGHRMLWTTPESLAESLPLVRRSGQHVLTADARIDNRDELLTTLGFDDRSHTVVSDSELILAAYERWGETCPAKLLGDFAFAIWDGRRRRLFCARDVFGVKPFYYYYRPGQIFAFSSEIKALFCVPEVLREIDERKVADYLASHAEDKTITFYKDIYRLQPAHSLTVYRDTMRVTEYWSLDPEREIRLSSPEAYAEAFRDIFTEAVRSRLRSAFPVGLTLSGGLDSTSVVCVAQGLRDTVDLPSLHTISCVFDDVPDSDERDYINLVATQDGITSHFVRPDQRSALHNIERVLWHQDQPIYVRNLFLWGAMYEAARENGVRVMLDGEDGDTIVSKGYHYLIDLARAGDWGAFAEITKGPAMKYFSCHEVPHGYWLWRFGLPHVRSLARSGQWRAFAAAVDDIARNFSITRRKLVVDHGLKPIAPPFLRRTWRRLRGRDVNGQRPKRGTASLLSSTLSARIGFESRYDALMHPFASPSTFREGHWQALTGGTHSAVLEEDDKASAAYTLEKRHPFFDRRLVEFCLALPPELRLYEGWPRWIQRRAMADILPEEIQWRIDKGDLGHNFDRSFLEFERERLTKLLQNPDGLESYVDMPALREAYSRGDGSTVWPAVILSLWLQSDLGGTLQG